MFTGIIHAVGRVAAVKPAARSAQVEIDAGPLDLGDLAVGDSIACNGVCLTVVRLSAAGFTVDISGETIGTTAGFGAGARVNLEKSLRLADRLGGHLVSGHVDGCGEVTAIDPVEGSREVMIRFPTQLGRYIARKGSIAVNGVSLTVNAVTGGAFSVNLIPHTLAATNLADLEPGDRVNLEIDLVARYVESMLSANRA
jgi:riboflavin synthase